MLDCAEVGAAEGGLGRLAEWVGEVGCGVVGGWMGRGVEKGWDGIEEGAETYSGGHCGCRAGEVVVVEDGS